MWKRPTPPLMPRPDVDTDVVDNDDVADIAIAAVQCTLQQSDVFRTGSRDGKRCRSPTTFQCTRVYVDYVANVLQGLYFNLPLPRARVMFLHRFVLMRSCMKTAKTALVLQLRLPKTVAKHYPRDDTCSCRCYFRLPETIDYSNMQPECYTDYRLSL